VAGAAVVVLVADQATKAVAVALVPPTGVSFGPVRVTVVRNSGGPFGVAPGTSIWWTVVSLAALTSLAVLAGRHVRSMGAAALVGVVVGGGVANVVDRLVRAPGVGNGAVIDWIEIAGYPRVVNLADVAIRVGALVLVVTMLAGSARTDRGRAGVQNSAGMPDAAGRVDAP
jgi:signal peptidase II